MQVSRPQLQDLDGLIEDTVSHLCDTHQLSGQLVWTAVESLATTKLAEFRDFRLPER